MPADTHAYIVRWPCGCAAALYVDNPRAADNLAYCLRTGLALERVAIAIARQTRLGYRHMETNVAGIVEKAKGGESDAR